MQSNAVKAGSIVLLAGLAIVLFVVLRGSDSEPDRTTAAPGAAAAGNNRPANPAPATITVKNGAPVGGVRALSFDKGEQVSFRVRSDVADEIHAHGYDLSKPVPAGRPVTMRFAASIEGVFEIELEKTGVQFAELTVNPG